MIEFLRLAREYRELASHTWAMEGDAANARIEEYKTISNNLTNIALSVLDNESEANEILDFYNEYYLEALEIMLDAQKELVEGIILKRLALLENAEMQRRQHA